MAQPAPGESPRFVYLVLSHNKPDQLLRLIRTLRRGSPDCQIVVHHDARSCPLPADVPGDLELLGVRLLIAQEAISWGDMSIVEAVLRSLRWIENNLTYDWIVQLSGQDYPIRPLGELEGRIVGGDVDAYVRHAIVGSTESDPSTMDDELRRRYFYQYYQLPRLQLGRFVPASAKAYLRKRKGAVQRLSVPVSVKALPRQQGVRLGRRSRHAPFPPAFPCYKGSMWVTLSRHATQRLLLTVDGRPKLVRYFRRTMIPDEAFIPTILANDPGVRLDADHLRFTSWQKGSLHPDTLTMDHLESIQASGQYLARKFDLDASPEIFDALDARILASAAPAPEPRPEHRPHSAA